MSFHGLDLEYEIYIITEYAGIKYTNQNNLYTRQNILYN